MKKRYIDCKQATWLSKHRYDIRYDQEKKAYISQILIEEIPFEIPVDYKGSNQKLLDVGYHCILLLPDDENWAMSAVYDDQKRIVEWYIDITKEHGIDGERPYFLDLYLDIAMDPNKNITLLDEDELQEAYDSKIITKQDYDLAYKTRNQVLSTVVNDLELLDHYMYSQIKDI